MGVAELQPAHQLRACAMQLWRGSAAVGHPTTDDRCARGAARRGGELRSQCVKAGVEHGLELAVRLAAELRRGALLPGPPGGDQDGRGVATGDQVGEDLDLLRLQRGSGDVPRQDLVRELQTVVATAEDVGCRHREVADERGMRHVPEVGDAGDRQRVVDEHVGGGQVVVHDLGAHPEQLRGDPLLEAVEHLTHRRTPRLVDRGEPRSAAAAGAGCPRRSGTTRPHARTREAPVPGGPRYAPTHAAAAGPIASGAGCRPSSHVITQARERRPSSPVSVTHRSPCRVGTTSGTGTSGATVRMWRRAEHWRSSTCSPSAGLCTFSR